MKHTFRSLVCLLLAVLLAAAVLTGCTQQKPAGASTEAPQQSTEARPDATPAATGAPASTEAPATTEAAPAETKTAAAEPQELGEGEKLFYFNVSFSDGETASYAIHTDAETVGEALVSLNLIAGEESQYGLYVKTVGEETLDYDTDHMFWAFYENGEFAAAGVDSTPVTDGATYAFAATEG